MTGNSIERLNKTDLIRVSILEKALRLELLGMKGRRSAYAIIKREFGMKGNRQTVHAELKSYLDSRKEFELNEVRQCDDCGAELPNDDYDDLCERCWNEPDPDNPDWRKDQ